MTDAKPDNVLVAYPEHEDCKIGHSAVQTFYDYCRSIKPVADLADRVHFDPFKLRPWLGYIMILDDLPDVNDFLYRMYGTQIARQSGFDLTGRRVSESQSPLNTFFRHLYRDCVARKSLIYSEHTRVLERTDCAWYRLLCPVQADGNTQVVVCNYPVARQRPLSDDI